MYKYLISDNLNKLFKKNAYKYTEQFDGDLLDQIDVSFDDTIQNDNYGASMDFLNTGNNTPRSLGGGNKYIFKVTDEALMIQFLKKRTAKITKQEFVDILCRTYLKDKIIYQILADNISDDVLQVNINIDDDQHDVSDDPNKSLWERLKHQYDNNKLECIKRIQEFLKCLNNKIIDPVSHINRILTNMGF